MARAGDRAALRPARSGRHHGFPRRVRRDRGAAPGRGRSATDFSRLRRAAREVPRPVRTLAAHERLNVFDSAPRTAHAVAKPVDPRTPWLNDRMRLSDLPTPQVVVDRRRLLANLDRVQQMASAAGMRLRPHAKTHKSPSIARWQIDRGAVGICCAKPGEAEVFAEAGIDDIRLPY